MTNIKSIKVSESKQAVRTNKQFDERATGPEPQWDTELALNFDDATFDHHLRRSFSYYNYHYNTKQIKKYLVDWLRRHGRFDQKVVTQFNSISDRYVLMTPCSLIMAHKAGMPLLEKHIKYLHQSVTDSLAMARNSGNLEEAQVATPTQVVERKVTIQDRLQERTSEIIGEIEGIYDQVIKKQDVSFKMYDFLTAHNVPQSQLTKISQMFSARAIELAAAQNKKDSQLVEGYSHYRRSDYQHIGKFIADLLVGIEEYRGIKRAVKKARVRKAPSKEKLVNKLRYAKDDKTLKLVSVNPIDTIGSQELWVYNSKTRKLGRYVAEHLGQLGIKGTSIVGFDQAKSIAKTLRKPAEQLKDFMQAGKIALRTWLKNIKAVEIKLNGRINEETLLLRVI
jgi:hypothetical protein